MGGGGSLGRRQEQGGRAETINRIIECSLFLSDVFIESEEVSLFFSEQLQPAFEHLVMQDETMIV